ncbi:MAG: hypothetical protein AAFX87_11175 [Bacteroidota bacterium]
MIKTSTSLLILIFICHLAHSQIYQPKRYEIEFENDDEYFNVLPADENGIILFRSIDNEGDFKHEHYEVKLLDTDLGEKWQKTIITDNKFSLKGFDYTQGYFYLLYKKGVRTRDGLHIVKIDVNTGDESTFDIENEVEFEFSHFVISGKNAVFGGYFSNRPTLVMYDMEDERMKVLPGFFQRSSFLLELKANDVQNTFNVLITEKNFANETTLIYKTFDNEGNTLVNNVIKLAGKMRILDGRTNDPSEQGLIITGLYSKLSSEMCDGVFFAKIRPGEDYEVKFHELENFESFFNYLPDKRKEKLKNKAKIKGADNFNFRSRLLMHELIQLDSDYLFVAEVFQPQFGAPTTSAYGRLYPGVGAPQPAQPVTQWVSHINRAQDTEGFSGFKYEQAFLVGFDENGEKLWDNSFQIEDVETFAPEQVVKVYADQHKVDLLYKYDDELRFKVIEKDRIVVRDTTVNLELLYPDDKLKNNNEEMTGVERWYDHYFFVWGYQRITNSLDNEVDQKRNVFYINKVYID